ncbi:hypothetical protein [Microvirga antarctica]|nr:hypothetical protein [Microvirga antarctica]
MIDHFFGDEPATDSATTIARALGTFVGLAVYVTLTLVALRGLF